MSERFDISFVVTREDWRAFNETVVLECPEWKGREANDRRTARQQVLWMGLFMLATAAALIARHHGAPWYLKVACIGAFVLLFLYFALPHLNAAKNATKENLELVRRWDFSTRTGMTRIVMDEHNVQILSPKSRLNLSWLAVSPAAVRGFVVLKYSGNGETIVPSRAFASDAAAAEFLDCARRWRQLAYVEQLERYLADRDLACSRCKYNLRGTRGDACPECGEPIRLEGLICT